jgi:hypothetical protein
MVANPVIFKYVDKNDDGKINTEDCDFIGHALPDFTWGLTNNFSYGPFQWISSIQGSQGKQLLNSNRVSSWNRGNGLSNASVKLLDRWTEDNPSNEYPRANRNAIICTCRTLSGRWFLYPGEDCHLAYDLPQRAMDFLNMKKAQALHHRSEPVYDHQLYRL